MGLIKRAVLLIGLILTLGSSLSVAAHADLPSGLSVSITLAKPSYNASDSLSVSVTYTNVSNSPIRFLTRGTALENEINEDFLNITFQGQPLPYFGRHVKRLPPTESDFLLLNPGQSASGTVDLGFSYPILKKGLYEITYKGIELGAGSSLSKSSGGVTLKLAEDRPDQTEKRTPNIDSSCNATQRAQIDQALGIAESISIAARNALNNAPVELRPTARRYTEWFGAFSTANYSTAQTAFNRISDALTNRTIGFDCTCNISNRNNVFAFVFANDPFNMNVCPVFFRVPARGTDSRSGTIVHEISHFNVVIGSDDFQSALNQSGSRQLANANPSAAIRNANAFEYFAENTPFLAMPTANNLPSSPDLVISSINSTNRNPETQESVGVSANIRNNGERQASATQVTLRLSSRAQISTTNTILDQTSVPILNAGASFNFQTNFQAPDQPGQFWIGVCVTAANGETSTSSNCSAAIPLLVTRPPADLAVDSVSSTDQNPTVEDPVGVTAVIINRGESRSSSTQVSLRISDDEVISISDSQLSQGSVPALNPGSSFNFQTNFLAPSEANQFWIGVCVTPVNGETVTNNNCSIAVPLLVEKRKVVAPFLFLLLEEDED